MISRARLTEQEPREDINDRRERWACIVASLVLYVIALVVFCESFRHSYTKSPCFVVNSTVVERQCCSKYSSKPTFDAVWVVDIRSNEFHSARYLADIRQKFSAYFEAYEAILTFHPVGSQQSCYVYSKNKFDVLWTDSSYQGIISALFGIGTLLFIIVLASKIQKNPP